MKKIWKDDSTLCENLQKRLPKLATRYFLRGREAMAPDMSWDDIHEFRLQTKRFRYTLEVFEDCYGGALTKQIEKLKKVQTLLGEANDCIVTAGMVDKLNGGSAISVELIAQAETKTAELRTWWAQKFDAPGQQEKWLVYLRKYACRPPEKKLAPAPKTKRR